ncbi:MULTISPECIES: hypothetical protein [Streptomycetaceae]|uniref:Uncharacterized protein n=1 Tax=Kitasatospora herbaricolor TaxID=68217 RepID=A0ABZ1WCQ3_9ACTN|nr:MULTISPECIES: hypothetical protein [Streptomycetaceae]MDQ0308707.1 hypothetical protein [Kitasatospora herbaricolor]OKI24020.1 hypothetical protein A6A07_03630 [Streptomyces sp. CB03911]GGV10642.1 hypothetical protein GCM10010495_25120 [Kitasatospora herbaricolor]
MRVIHEMKLVGRLGTGADEWTCPTCGRRVSLRRLPEPELIVLDPGDESAVHVGVIEPDAASAAAAERYGLGPIQEIPRSPRTPDPAAAAAPAARQEQPARPAPHADDRRWLAEIGIDWDGETAA